MVLPPASVLVVLLSAVSESFFCSEEEPEDFLEVLEELPDVFFEPELSEEELPSEEEAELLLDWELRPCF